jgi:hypothetical protein
MSQHRRPVDPELRDKIRHGAPAWYAATSSSISAARSRRWVSFRRSGRSCPCAALVHSAAPRSRRRSAALTRGFEYRPSNSTPPLAISRRGPSHRVIA